MVPGNREQEVGCVLGEFWGILGTLGDSESLGLWDSGKYLFTFHATRGMLRNKANQ
jgi:hypothetical protein